MKVLLKHARKFSWMNLVEMVTLQKKMLIEIFQKVEEVGNSLSEDLSDSEMLERIYVKLGAEPEKARFIINKAFPLERGKPIEYYFRMGIHLSAEYDEANAH